MGLGREKNIVQYSRCLDIVTGRDLGAGAERKLGG